MSRFENIDIHCHILARSDLRLFWKLINTFIVTFSIHVIWRRKRFVLICFALLGTNFGVFVIKLVWNEWKVIREMIIKSQSQSQSEWADLAWANEITEERNKQRNQKWGKRCWCARTCNELVLACGPHNSKTCSTYKFRTWLNVAAAAVACIWNYDTIVAHWKFIDAVVLHSSYHNKFIINAETFGLLKMHYANECVHRYVYNFLPLIKCACRHDEEFNGNVLLLIFYFIFNSVFVFLLPMPMLCVSRFSAIIFSRYLFSSFNAQS